MNGVTWKPKNLTEIKQHTILVEPHSHVKEFWLYPAYKNNDYYKLRLNTLYSRPMTIWGWSENVLFPSFCELHNYVNPVFNQYSFLHNKLNHITVPYNLLGIAKHVNLSILMIQLLDLKQRGATVTVDVPSDSEFESLTPIISALYCFNHSKEAILKEIPFYQKQKQFLPYLNCYPQLTHSLTWNCNKKED